MPQQLNLPNFFAGPYIDRRSEVREDEAALRAIRADPQTRYVLSVGGLQLLHAEGPASAARVAFLSSDDPIVRGTAETDLLVLLGQFQDSWCLLIDLPADAAVTLPEGTHFAELRPLVATLSAAESALLAYARGLSLWRARQRF